MDDRAVGISKNDLMNSLESHKRCLRAVLPVVPDESKAQESFERLKISFLKIYKTYLICSTRETRVSEALKEVEEQAKDIDAIKDLEEIFKQMEEVVCKSDEEYSKTLTDEYIFKDPGFLKLFKGLEEIYEDIQAQKCSSNDNDAEDMQEDEARSTTDKRGKRKNKKNSVDGEADSADDEDFGTDYCPTIDPVSKKPLIHPVVNIYCNHIYEYTTIIEMMQCSRKLKCPMPGCSNKQYLRPNHLREDPEISQRIAERIQSQQQNG